MLSEGGAWNFDEWIYPPAIVARQVAERSLFVNNKYSLKKRDCLTGFTAYPKIQDEVAF
jgi:hypothetical protein